MAYLTKKPDTILNQALRKLSSTTNITSVSPGSIARALTEAVTTEIGDLYSAIDFNMSMSALSTTAGVHLDMIGSLYKVNRKTLTEIAAIDKSIGAFYFYIDSPHNQAINIPVGTRIYTNIDEYIGSQFVYATTEAVTIPIGRTRAYATIRPQFADSVFTAGPGSLTLLDPSFAQPVGKTVKATNPKPIVGQVGVEDDDSYRARVIQGVRTVAGSTIGAIRMAGLNVPGVRDITIRDAAYGLGSFEALIVSEDNLLNGPVIRAAGTVMESVRPVGVRMYVRQPTLLPVDVYATISIRPGLTVDGPTVGRRAEIGILRYLNTMLIGTPLVYNQLIQAIFEATDVVADVTLTRFAVNATEVLRQNYSPSNDEQIIPGDIQVSVAS